MRTGADNKILKKLYMKVVAAAITLVIVITMTVSVTYAWMILSTSPTASGAQLNLAGGTTILLAPDISVTDDNGVTVHYPGKFSDKLSLAESLGNYAGLAPVSTADGVNWVIAEFDQTTGRMKEISEFSVDNTLSKANLTSFDNTGSYIYIDFWVVSPGSDYVLRVSCDAKAKEGSSLIEFPAAAVDEDEDSGFSIKEPYGGAAASLRIGFLTNDAIPDDIFMASYAASQNYETRYSKILGVLPEKGTAATDPDDYTFTIFEPNGTLHPDGTDGEYIITKPLAPVNGTIEAVDIGDKLTVQTKSEWKLEDDAAHGFTGLDRVFQTGVSALTGTKTVKNVTERFLNECVGWANVPAYIKTGVFFKNTSDLYESAENGKVSKETVSGLNTAGATDDVSIAALTRNTPQRVRMFIWLEGQDADCSKVAEGVTDFIINLELAGADQ